MAVSIVPGMKVIAHSSFNGDLERRAVSSVVDGHDFPVVWVCTEEEWSASQAAEEQKPDAIPWPAEDVRPVVV